MSTKKPAANVKLVPGPDGKYYCPECKTGPYETAKGLSSHRRTVHKIIGWAPSSISGRKRKAAERAGLEPAPKENKTLSERRREERDFKREYRLRKRREELAAQSAPATAEIEPTATTPSTKENESDATKHGKKRGPYKPRKRQRADRKELATTREIEVRLPHQADQEYYDHRNPPRIPESTLLVAYGRFLEFSASLAREYDLPARQFAAELVAAIRRST